MWRCCRSRAARAGRTPSVPEQDGQLGVIRTTELLAADSHYGVHQYFTRALDNGFSKSPDQMLKYWGDLPVEDMVRVIRTYRPNVVINGWGGEHAGHGQHQASGILTPRAVGEAADPNAFPAANCRRAGAVEGDVGGAACGAHGSGVEQGGGVARGRGVDAAARCVAFVGRELHSRWAWTAGRRTGRRGRRRFSAAAFSGGRSIWRRRMKKASCRTAFDPHVLNEPITALSGPILEIPRAAGTGAGRGGPRFDGGAEIRRSIWTATRRRSRLRKRASKWRRCKGKLPQGNEEEAAAARWEIERVRERIDRALESDVALSLGTQADRHELVAGEKFSVDVILAGKPAVPVKWTVDKSSMVLPPDGARRPNR